MTALKRSREFRNDNTLLQRTATRSPFVIIVALLVACQGANQRTDVRDNTLAGSPEPATERLSPCGDARAQRLTIGISGPDTVAEATLIDFVISVSNPQRVPVAVDVHDDMTPWQVRVRDALGVELDSNRNSWEVGFRTLSLPPGGAIQYRYQWNQVSDFLSRRVDPNRAYYVEGFLLTRDPMACKATHRVWIARSTASPQR